MHSETEIINMSYTERITKIHTITLIMLQILFSYVTFFFTERNVLIVIEYQQL